MHHRSKICVIVIKTSGRIDVFFIKRLHAPRSKLSTKWWPLLTPESEPISSPIPI